MTDFNELPVSDEGTPADTFSYAPDYEITIERHFSNINQSFEADYEQSFPRLSPVRRTVRLGFISKTESERDAIMSFFETHFDVPFWFTFEDETEPSKACLKNGSLKSDKINPDVYNIEMDFEELY